LALKPGKPQNPSWLAELAPSPFFGLPGNPVSALINLYLFGRPLVEAHSGLGPSRPRGQMAMAATPIPHVHGRTEFAPARIVCRNKDGRSVVQKVVPSGSARLRAMVLADGFLKIRVVPAISP
jgi:molybdopterin molybdotransferase